MGCRSNIAIRGKYSKDKSRDLLHCWTCGKWFGATQASALLGLHLSAETIRQIIHPAAEGVGVRATGRLQELGKDTVNRLILRAGEHCAHVFTGLLTSLEIIELQLNELWTFEKNSGNAEDLEGQYGRTWIWTSIDALTRLLIMFWIDAEPEQEDAMRKITYRV